MPASDEPAPPRWIFADIPPGDFESPGLIPNPEFEIAEEDRTEAKELLCNCGTTFTSTPLVWRGAPVGASLFCPTCEAAHAAWLATRKGLPIRKDPEDNIPGKTAAAPKKPLTPMEEKFKRIQEKLNAARDSRSHLSAGCQQPSDTAPKDSMPCAQPESTTPSLPMSSSTPNDTPSSPGSTGKEMSCTGSTASSESPTSGEATVGAPNHSARTHAKHSPSGHKPKSVCEGFRNEQTDEWKKFAERGERGHEAYEKEDPTLVPSDDETLRDAVKQCLAYSRRFPGKVYKELRLPTLYEFGYVDRLHVAKHAHIFDPKFSFNKWEADSGQFWDYAIGVFKKFPEVEKITVHVLMPFLGLIDTETWTRSEDLPRLVQNVSAIVTRAETNDPTKYRVSEFCRFCANAGGCPALGALAIDVARKYDDKILALPAAAFEAPAIAKGEIMAALLNAKPVIEKALSSWSERAKEMWQEDGIEIPGYAIKERESPRKVTNAQVAWEICQSVNISPEEFSAIATVGIGDLEKLYASKFSKGKGKAKDQLDSLLTDRDAISQGGTSYYLAKQKG